MAVSNKDRTSGLQCCAFCRRQAGAVDGGAPPLESGGAARIALVDGIDDSCFMVWQVIFKKFTAQDARGPQCTPRDCNLSESHVLYSCRACVRVCYMCVLCIPCSRCISVSCSFQEMATILKSTDQSDPATKHIRDRFHGAHTNLLNYTKTGLIVMPGRQQLLDSLNMHPGIDTCNLNCAFVCA